MKKFLFLCLLIFSITSFSACSNKSVSSSKAKDTTTKTTTGANTTTGQTVENANESTETEPSTTETVNSSTTSPAETSISSQTDAKLGVTFPSQTGSYTTGYNWNVIRGTVSTKANAIEVNGYRLQKFVAGSQNWNYIAAVKMQTLHTGKNEYVIKSFDADENVIEETTFYITYQNGYILPNVGTSLNFIIFLTFIFSLNLFIRRKNA